MPDACALARSYGVAVEFADLGTWGHVDLQAEYDPLGPVIRVHARALREPRAFVERAIAHELYHHLEAIGAVPRIAPHRAREAAADRFAESVVSAR